MSYRSPQLSRHQRPSTPVRHLLPEDSQPGVSSEEKKGLLPPLHQLSSPSTQRRVTSQVASATLAQSNSPQFSPTRRRSLHLTELQSLPDAVLSEIPGSQSSTKKPSFSQALQIGSPALPNWCESFF